jgi:hypothetical protein
VNRRDLALVGAAVLLLVVAIIRVTAPDRSRLRPVAIESCFVPSVTLEAGDRLVREHQWLAPDDVFVVGWQPWRNLPPGVTHRSELMLYDGVAHSTLFVATDRDPQGDAALPYGGLPAGTGYRLEKGHPLTLRYTVENKGQTAFDSGGAGALLYFVHASE